MNIRIFIIIIIISLPAFTCLSTIDHSHSNSSKMSEHHLELVDYSKIANNSAEKNADCTPQCSSNCHSLHHLIEVLKEKICLVSLYELVSIKFQHQDIRISNFNIGVFRPPIS